MDDNANPQDISEIPHNDTTSMAPSAGAFFPQAHSFVLSGGTFTSTTNIHNPPSSRTDFRMISLEDIDLREIRLDYGVVHRSHGEGLLKRTYSARFHGRHSSMTVILYHGDTAEEEWHHDISQYSTFRHPNFLQFYGAATSSALYATIFHDDLMPFSHFKNHCRSPLWTVYIYACFDTGIRAVWECLNSASPNLTCLESVFWLRRSTGRLCFDLSPPHYIGDSPGTFDVLNNLSVSDPWCTVSCFKPQPESTIIASLTLEVYHWLVPAVLSHCFWMTTSDWALLGSVVCYDPGLPGSQFEALAELPDGCDLSTSNHPRLDEGTVLENGWTRLNSGDVGNSLEIHMNINGMFWLAQANNIFCRLQVTSNHKQYVLLSSIGGVFGFSETVNKPKGYLFVCPLNNIRMGSSKLFRLPDCPAYWSLDPLGNERLSPEDAEHLGFPVISFQMYAIGVSWDTSVYMGCYQMALAKGFDPNSQDVARHFNYPLYELSAPFAHIDDELFNIPGDESDIIVPINEQLNMHESAPADFALRNVAGTHNLGFPNSLEVEMIPLSTSCSVLIYVKLTLVIYLTLHSILGSI